MRFVHTADWQLGMTRRYLDPEAQSRYSGARRDAVAGVASAAAGAEFVVVAGDVFDDNQLPPAVVSRSLEAMRAIGVPVYLLPGNHDPLDASSVYTSPLFTAECPANVTVLDRAGVYDVRPGLQLVAVPWRSKRPTHDQVAGVLEGLVADGTTRILVAHGSVDLLDPDPSRPWVIGTAAIESALAGGALHYAALGDRHSRTSVGGSGRVWYPGSPEPTNFDDIEPGSGEVLVVDIDETQPRRPVTVTATPVGTWRFLTLRRTVDDDRDIADLDVNLDQLLAKERTVVRVALTGSLTVTDHAALDACLDRHARLFASLQVWESHSHLAMVPADGEFDDLGVGGFAAAAVAELAAAAADGPQAHDAQAALTLLLRLLDGAAA